MHIRYFKDSPRCKMVWYHCIESCCYSNEREVVRVQVAECVILDCIALFAPSPSIGLARLIDPSGRSSWATLTV